MGEPRSRSSGRNFRINTSALTKVSSSSPDSGLGIGRALLLFDFVMGRAHSALCFSAVSLLFSDCIIF